ncbi:transposase [Micromonospora sp. WMMD1102]|uniref:transposase n=1 Tax=Micromonospora sp. WMMD1102 TaxID=3016105 RepID=UPI0024150B8D|nr:transposase [Micromonospora sp. WMMD1102]MDG4784463.1 transposase [Micromonospora sp. WMMD1102]
MSREEDDAVALVRVYCGLASADTTGRPTSAGATLTSAVVDDAGRLLHVCEITDDPAGYAQLGAVLVERSSGPSGAAVAADSDDHMVTSLLSAAGRPLVIADDDSVDDFAERFADDESAEERDSAPAERRAVGLARALQAGALSAATLPAPRELAGFKPVLAAHAALANGRHAAAVALREVLRELYPAALRAYPDPAEPVSLAVLDALPEPGMLSGTAARGRDTSVATDAIAAHLAADGVAEADVITEAVTALRVAIAETPRRGAANKALTSAAAETVRQAVAAVRACDAGCDALVATLTARVSTPEPVRRAGRRSAGEAASQVGAGLPGPTREPLPSSGRRNRHQPAASSPPARPQPMGPPPVAPAPVAPPPMAPQPVTPSAAPPLSPAATLSMPVVPVSGPPREPRTAPPSSAPPAYHADTLANRPVSAPPPPPGMTPMPAQRGAIPPAEAGEPFRATLTTAAINSARSERRPTPITPRPKTNGESAARPGTISAAGLTVSVPATRPEPPAPPGSRANWPLVNPGDEQDDRAGGSGYRAYPGGQSEQRDAPVSAAPADGRVTPPWQADDLPPEPPTLRLVEPPPLADRTLHNGLPTDNPPLRLVDRDEPTAQAGSGLPRRATAEPSAPPVADEGDGDLLIFAAARSAWFTGHPEEAEVEWSSTADSGWRAAEQAARPSVGASTTAGLPKRVPQANLVPGSPLRDERPLRIVRDAARIAEHTTGYFRGWRRGQEIGGYAVGGRPGREAAGGWDFSRDPDERADNRDYEYRSASYRS